MKTTLQWTVGFCSNPQQIPDRMISAQVPGAVQLDWARAEGWTLPEDGGSPADYRWMEDVYWMYRTRLDFSPPNQGQSLYFICGGVDYQFQVRLGGQIIHEQEGMFTPIELDLSGRASPGDILEILVYPAPKSHHNLDDRNQANQSVKPAVSYGWDFHPRLIPLGIWEETYLELRPTCHLRSAEVFYELNDDLSRAVLRLETTLSQAGNDWVLWRLFDPQGALVFQKQRPASAQASFTSELIHPTLWWPNGQGEPALYRSVTQLLDENGALVEEKSSRVGFRRVRLVMHPNGWADPEENGFPRGPDRPPMTLEINGRSIFAKGSNWVSPEIFPGRLNVDLYRAQLTQAQAANFNLLRCWGGAPVQKEAFFDLCDEFGLMVWQEFPLACTRYESTPHYMRILDQESCSIIHRLRPHPAVVIWCGGNELFNSWSRMTNQDLALRLLNRNCFDLDPQRPFLYTSPQMGVGHGSYTFRIPDGSEVYQYFSKAHRTAYTEFGVSGPPNISVLRRFISDEELFPPRPNSAWETHHAYRAWDGSETSWLEVPTLKDYFGDLPNLEALVEAGQLLQAEGLRCIFEEARRQKPVCSMALNWCFNEPWPTAANGSLISWPAEPKPALDTVRLACRPVLASAQAEKFSWKAGDVFTAALWLLNDHPYALQNGEMQAVLKIDGAEYPLAIWQFQAAQPNANLSGPTLRLRLPVMNSPRFELILRIPSHPEWDSVYTYLVAKP